ncbi:metallohydrolase [Bradyrhizobium sp. 179]|uniref:metallohydrolase n=1 Tax=Bradyrhizobium sp. 179 TaxID=2782648 RepID=UPI001FF775F1|nr:metallohydrolase [Bradyrhizobium sp. 179]
MAVAAKATLFKVDNGDMTLFETETGKRILCDINIRQAADGTDDDTPDVVKQLRNKLDRDEKGRLFVDAFLNTHPDADHIRGLIKHFHLGDPSTWVKADDKIIIREMWSSPIVFRRARAKDEDHVLCADAEAWRDEARRRTNKYKKDRSAVDGNRILILGEDVDGKTDDLADVLVKVDEVFSKICGVHDTSFEARLLAPMPADDEEEEELLTKNNSSVITRLDLKVSKVTRGRFLLGGDAEVAIWDRIWERNKKWPERLQYDVLIAPHHCSWHSLSYDSWSDKGEKAKVSEPARCALGQPLGGALIVASSKPIKDDENDPPCIRAKREYLDILDPVKGEFKCVAHSPGDDPLMIEVSSAGPRIKRAVFAVSVAAGTGIGSQPLAHG